VSDKNRFNLRSTTRAAVVFMLPDKGRIITQGHHDKVDQKLRDAISAAWEEFRRVYYAKDKP